MLTKQEIKHIADLARIELTEEQIKKYQDQLGKILDYMEKLKQVDTSGVATADGGTIDLKNIWREDVARDMRHESRDNNNLINMAPSVENGQVKVKSVFN